MLDNTAHNNERKTVNFYNKGQNVILKTSVNGYNQHVNGDPAHSNLMNSYSSEVQQIVLLSFHGWMAYVLGLWVSTF